MACNTNIHSSTGFSPFYLMFGHQARLPVDVVFDTNRPEIDQSPSEYAAKLDQKLKSAFEIANETAGVQCERQKHYDDQKAHGTSYNQGNLVWLLTPKVPKNSSKNSSTPGIVHSKF